MPGIYVPSRDVHQSIRASRLVDDYLTDEEELEQMLVCSMFMTKVFQACRDAGVTPQSATGLEVNLISLMIDVEMELGIHQSPLELDMLNRWPKYREEWRIARRRRWCFAVLYRMVSGRIVS